MIELYTIHLQIPRTISPKTEKTHRKTRSEKNGNFKLQFIVLFESTQQAAKLPRHCEEGQCPDVAISSNIYR